ncbi:uncharacterized protein LOC118646684 [Monomorium pharaonis]|uniref:uncharacterized protein LOC118646684 n=1 Tax=Monomorium pharaonis TaxID=307658 RepID=UPI001747A813|nr:uncharacterized protein LOC118646684 [Monomorium pharaonis]
MGLTGVGFTQTNLGLAGCGRLFRSPHEDQPRACVAVKGLENQLLSDFCSRDLVAVVIEDASGTEIKTKMVVASGYFPHEEDDPLPSDRVVRLMKFCQKEQFPLILGCDANAHHTVWGSTDTNRRGEKLLKFLVSTDLEILNRGREPTFITAVRKEVLDLTICSRQVVQEVTGWRVSDELSLSDHRQITFRLAKVQAKVRSVRDPRKTDWDSFREDLAVGLREFPKRHGTPQEIELCVEHLQRALVGSFQDNCPERTELRSAARRAWNRARNKGRQADWDLHRRTQKAYRDSVIMAKKESWRRFCESVERIPEAARLGRILARDRDAALEAIRLDDGTIASGERCLNHLLESNFPGFRGGYEEKTGLLRQKSLGLTRSNRPAWRQARVVFIPKAGRTGYSSAKDFRPISLTSFLLKTLERLVDVYIRDVVLLQHQLHVNQHAYRTGHSTESALHSAVSFIEEQLERKGFVVGTFLDIEGAFNNTPHEVVCEEATRRGVPERTVDWIRGMLGRQVTASLGTVKVSGWVKRGCPQGGVLSPLLWCLVADRLLRTLNERSFFTLGYADDLAILIRGPFLETLLELTQRALEAIEEWFSETGLAVNPLKTGLVIFTRKYKTWGLKPKMVHWIYTAILRRRLLYASVVWWPKVLGKTAKLTLEHVRALVLRGALGAMRTTPVAAMGMVKRFKALEDPKINLRLVWDCKCVLDKLAEKNDVGLVWVPGHAGIKGNEMADLLAKEAAETRLDLAKSIRSLGRKDARLATQLLMGHGDLNYHLHKLGRSDTPSCRLCGEEKETSLHIFGNCPALVGPKTRLLGSGFLEPNQFPWDDDDPRDDPETTAAPETKRNIRLIISRKNVCCENPSGGDPIGGSSLSDGCNSDELPAFLSKAAILEGDPLPLGGYKEAGDCVNLRKKDSATNCTHLLRAKTRAEMSPLAGSRVEGSAAKPNFWDWPDDPSGSGEQWGELLLDQEHGEDTVAL